MENVVTIEIQLVAEIEQDQAIGVWIARVPALGLVSQGRTFERAKAAAHDAAELYVKHCYQRKILDDRLNERGFVEQDGKPDGDHQGQYVAVTSQRVPFAVKLSRSQKATACQPL